MWDGWRGGAGHERLSQFTLTLQKIEAGLPMTTMTAKGATAVVRKEAARAGARAAAREAAAARKAARAATREAAKAAAAARGAELPQALGATRAATGV